MWLTALLVGAGLAGGLRLSYLHDHFLQLAFAAFLAASALSAFLYLKALFAPETALAPGGNSGERLERPPARPEGEAPCPLLFLPPLSLPKTAPGRLTLPHSSPRREPRL